MPHIFLQTNAPFPSVKQLFPCSKPKITNLFWSKCWYTFFFPLVFAGIEFHPWIKKSFSGFTFLRWKLWYCCSLLNQDVSFTSKVTHDSNFFLNYVKLSSKLELTSNWLYPLFRLYMKPAFLWRLFCQYQISLLNFVVREFYTPNIIHLTNMVRDLNMY